MCWLDRRGLRWIAHGAAAALHLPPVMEGGSNGSG